MTNLALTDPPADAASTSSGLPVPTTLLDLVMLLLCFSLLMVAHRELPTAPGGPSAAPGLTADAGPALPQRWSERRAAYYYGVLRERQPAAGLVLLSAGRLRVSLEAASVDEGLIALLAQAARQGAQVRLGVSVEAASLATSAQELTDPYAGIGDAVRAMRQRLAPRLGTALKPGLLIVPSGDVAAPRQLLLEVHFQGP